MHSFTLRSALRNWRRLKRRCKTIRIKVAASQTQVLTWLLELAMPIYKIPHHHTSQLCPHQPQAPSSLTRMLRQLP
eukprot:2203529-Amphidinium_carterae.1